METPSGTERSSTKGLGTIRTKTNSGIQIILSRKHPITCRSEIKTMTSVVARSLSRAGSMVVVKMETQSGTERSGTKGLGTIRTKTNSGIQII